MNPAKRRAIFERFRAANPDPRTELDYTIAFNSAIPGLAGVVAKQLTAALTKGLPKLVP